MIKNFIFDFGNVLTQYDPIAWATNIMAVSYTHLALIAVGSDDICIVFTFLNVQYIGNQIRINVCRWNGIRLVQYIILEAAADIN